jgi:hypothetical protein
MDILSLGLLSWIWAEAHGVATRTRNESITYFVSKPNLLYSWDEAPSSTVGCVSAQLLISILHQMKDQSIIIVTQIGKSPRERNWLWRARNSK